jgi:hypothetical protein
MEKDIAVNKALMSMQMKGLIFEDAVGEIRQFLGQVYMVGWEQRNRELSAHHNKKVIQYDKNGNEVARFNKISEAAMANKCSRDVIDDSVTRRIKISRKGYYFRYVENGDNKG